MTNTALPVPLLTDAALYCIQMLAGLFLGVPVGKVMAALAKAADFVVNCW